VLLRILEHTIKQGTLELRLPDGGRRRFGSGEPRAEWLIDEPQALRRIALNPGLALGESYMDAEWRAGEGGLLALFEVLMRNFPNGPSGGHPLARLLPRAWGQLNRVARSYRNVSRHYDLDESMFRLFLDEDLQYSCAYFPEPDVSLEEAQRAKCRHIAAKLLLRPGDTVLDIGCGWGGLALYIAAASDAHVTGVTLSREQLRVARERARERGLEGRVRFELEDYREHRGRYRRVVSVGMFEHVGRLYYRTFFARLRELLTEDGVALVHTIGRSGPPAAATNPWIQRYIFPGGYLPALSELMRAVEPNRLVVTDVEILRIHYAQTLAHWHARFQHHRSEIASRLGERFCRMWEFYLVSCEAGFRWWDLVVFQVQLARDKQAVPVTRDYLYGEAQAAARRVRDRPVDAFSK